MLIDERLTCLVQKCVKFNYFIQDINKYCNFRSMLSHKRCFILHQQDHKFYYFIKSNFTLLKVSYLDGNKIFMKSLDNRMKSEFKIKGNYLFRDEFNTQMISNSVSIPEIRKIILTALSYLFIIMVT